LANAITAHLRETEEHVKRLETVFGMFKKKPNAKRCRGMEGLIDEGDRAARGDGNEALVDAGIVAAAQRVEHYEIAAYGCLMHYAELLGMTDAADLLSVTCKEERAADAKLTQVSDEEIGELAMAAGRDGEPEWHAGKIEPH
jgi:ferritin-like metal-binding protein YciE